IDSRSALRRLWHRAATGAFLCPILCRLRLRRLAFTATDVRSSEERAKKGDRHELLHGEVLSFFEVKRSVPADHGRDALSINQPGFFSSILPSFFSSAGGVGLTFLVSSFFGGFGV